MKHFFWLPEISNLNPVYSGVKIIENPSGGFFLLTGGPSSGSGSMLFKLDANGNQIPW